MINEKRHIRHLCAVAFGFLLPEMIWGRPQSASFRLSQVFFIIPQLIGIALALFYTNFQWIHYRQRSRAYIGIAYLAIIAFLSIALHQSTFRICLRTCCILPASCVSSIVNPTSIQPCSNELISFSRFFLLLMHWFGTFLCFLVHGIIISSNEFHVLNI